MLAACHNLPYLCTSNPHKGLHELITKHLITL